MAVCTKFKEGDTVRIKSKNYASWSGLCDGDHIGEIGYIEEVLPTPPVSYSVYSINGHNSGDYLGIFDDNDLEPVHETATGTRTSSPDAFNPYFVSWENYTGCDFGAETPKKGIKTMLSILAKKLLDGDVKALVEVGWLDSELELTDEGEEAVFALFVEQNKEELAKRAKEELKKKKDK